MKNNIFKIVLLLVIFVGTALITVYNSADPFRARFVLNPKTNTYELVQKEKKEKAKDPKWEYVKDRLFDGESYLVKKFQGPILLELNGASKKDSIAVAQLISELKELLPNKTIGYFKNFTGKRRTEWPPLEDSQTIVQGHQYMDLWSAVINLNFNKKVNNYGLEVSRTNFMDGNSVTRTLNISSWELNFNFRAVGYMFNDSISNQKRKTYIRYGFYKALCYIQPKPLNKESSFKNGIFYSAIDNGQNVNFNEADKFLLQKLYSDDFYKQFRTYLIKKDSYRVAINSLDRDGAKRIAFVIVALLGILIFVLSLGLFSTKRNRYSYFNYLAPLLVIVLSMTHLQLFYDHLTQLNLVIWWNSFVIDYINYGVLAIVASLILWTLERYIIKKSMNFTIQLILKTSFVYFSIVISKLIIGTLIVSLFNKYMYFTSEIYVFAIFLAIGRGVILYLNHLSDSLLKEKDVQLSRLKELNATAELKSLHAHVNPHFLYNALNAIAGLAHTDADKTEKMALSLSDLFRYKINKKGEKLSTVADEVAMLKNYLEIEQIRFGDRLVFEINVEKELEKEQIPMFILQPLVENAVKHGISQIENTGKIALNIKKQEKGITISVSDNGPDFPEGLVSGHGLQTVYDLLRISYGENADISWENTPIKCITVSITKSTK